MKEDSEYLLWVLQYFSDGLSEACESYGHQYKVAYKLAKSIAQDVVRETVEETFVPYNLDEIPTKWCDETMRRVAEILGEPTQ